MPSTPEDSLQQGLRNRRQVLGADWVAQSVDNANSLNVEF